MISKLAKKMLAAQTLSALTVSLCLLIDNIMIGRYLGERALTAYGLANPILLAIGAIGSTLCAGIQVACSKSLGRGDREETNVGYSSALATAGGLSLAFTLPALLFSTQVAQLLGAGEPALLSDTSRYIAGFSIGVPASVAALVLVPFLQMAGRSSLLIVAVLGMTVADVAFDFLNVLVFHGGMFGMGLASALSYYSAILLCGWYFLSKKCVFSFSLRRIRWRKIKELLVGGVPTVIGMVSSAVLVFAVNRILLDVGGAAAVAAFSVINTVINACNSISAGAGGVGLTVSGVLYNEEDRTGLSELLRTLLRSSLVMGAVATALLLVFARPCAALFIPYAGESRALAVWGLRAFSLGLTGSCLNATLKNCYQGTGRVRMMEVISAVDNALLPILAALLLSRAAGVNGTWFLFVTSEMLTLLGIFAYVWWKKRRFVWRPEDILLLRGDLVVPPEDLLEASPADVDDVIAFSHAAETFCLSHGGSERMAGYLALCIEEMGCNIVTHGFAANRNRHLFIRILYKAGRWTLRFRDDCIAFDPIRHISGANVLDSVGIRLAMRVADEAHYTYAMDLNNLALVLQEPPE